MRLCGVMALMTSLMTASAAASAAMLVVSTLMPALAGVKMLEASAVVLEVSVMMPVAMRLALTEMVAASLAELKTRSPRGRQLA